MLAFRDIGGRRRAEETLARLRALVESSFDAIIGKTLDGEITSWSAGAQRIYGYSAEEMVGQSIALLAPEDRVDEVPRLMALIRRGEAIADHRTVRRHKDGRPVPVSLSIAPLRDGQGSPIGASTIAHDLSAEEGREIEYRSILAATQDGFIALDPEARFVDANDASCGLMGCPRWELMGRELVEVVAESHRADVGPRVRELLLAGRGRFETRHRARDGRLIDFEVTANFIDVAGGRLVAFLREITERKRSEVLLRAEEERLSSLLRLSPA